MFLFYCNFSFYITTHISLLHDSFLFDQYHLLFHYLIHYLIHYLFRKEAQTAEFLTVLFGDGPMGLTLTKDSKGKYARTYTYVVLRTIDFLYIIIFLDHFKELLSVR